MHASSRPPTHWPHLLVEAGPPIAGIGPGDAIAFALDEPIWLRTYAWTLADDRDGVYGGRTALTIQRAPFGHTNADEHRVSSRTLRPEHVSHAGNNDGTKPWRPLDNDVVTVGGAKVRDEAAWRLRFVVDGPPLATRKTFGQHDVVHAHDLSFDPMSESVSSRWVLPAHEARDALVVTESFDGRLTFRTERRRAGVAVDALRAAIDRAPLDAELAAGIVAQMAHEQPASWLAFDGEVFAIGSRPVAYDNVTRFARLTLPPPWPSGNEFPQRDDVAALLARTRPASKDELAGFLRALLPDAWAREQALVEECRVLAG